MSIFTQHITHAGTGCGTSNMIILEPSGPDVLLHLGEHDWAGGHELHSSIDMSMPEVEALRDKLSELLEGGAA